VPFAILQHLTADTARIVRAMFAKGNQIDCSGDVFNNQGNTITCTGEITDEMLQGGVWWDIALTLTEVSNADTGIPEPGTTDIADDVKLLAARLVSFSTRDDHATSVFLECDP
jgi:hypothetical protein